MAQKGRSVCVYIREDLLERVKSTGNSVSKVVNEALEQYLALNNRAKDAERVVKLLAAFRGIDFSLPEAWEKVNLERGHDRI